MIQNQLATTPKSISLQDLKPSSGFSFLMDNEIEKKYRAWMGVAVENFSADNEEELKEVEDEVVVPEEVPASPVEVSPKLTELEKHVFKRT